MTKMLLPIINFDFYKNKTATGGEMENFMKTIKRASLLLLSIVILLFACLMTGCGSSKKDKGHEEYIKELGGVSETFTGEISEENYETQEDAASAFVEEQLAGYKDVRITKTESQGTLNDSEIENLNLTEDDSKDIVSIEKVSVTYSLPNTAGINEKNSIIPVGTLNTEKTAVVYIIKYPNFFKYYSPCPITGDTVNKSYYDSVFNSEKYKNCTYTVSETIDVKTKAAGLVTVKMRTTFDQKILYSENAIYIEQIETTKPIGTSSMLLEEEEKTLYIYIEKQGDDIACYSSEDNETWTPTKLYQIGFNDLDELLPFANKQLDYTYFTKSDFGFELNSENAEQYVNQTMGSVLKSEGANDTDISMYAKYYVCEGVLTGLRVDVEMEFSMEEDGIDCDCDATATTVATVSDYGTTVVEKPF